MREALESRAVIEELKAQNEKLQRDIYGLHSKINLMYESCADLKGVDRFGDLMQRKLHEPQVLQAARNDPASLVNRQDNTSRSPRKGGPADKGFICGSRNFQDGAVYPSSYKGQTSRCNFHRVRVLEAEEARLRDRLDIFGVPVLPLQNTASFQPTKSTGDTIDELLVSAEEATSPMRSARKDTRRAYGCVDYDMGSAGSSRLQG